MSIRSFRPGWGLLCRLLADGSITLCDIEGTSFIYYISTRYCGYVLRAAYRARLSPYPDYGSFRMAGSPLLTYFRDVVDRDYGTYDRTLGDHLRRAMMYWNLNPSGFGFSAVGHHSGLYRDLVDSVGPVARTIRGLTGLDVDYGVLVGTFAYTVAPVIGNGFHQFFDWRSRPQARLFELLGLDDRLTLIYAVWYDSGRGKVIVKPRKRPRGSMRKFDLIEFTDFEPLDFEITVSIGDEIALVQCWVLLAMTHSVIIKPAIYRGYRRRSYRSAFVVRSWMPPIGYCQYWISALARGAAPECSRYTPRRSY